VVIYIKNRAQYCAMLFCALVYFVCFTIAASQIPHVAIRRVAIVVSVLAIDDDDDVVAIVLVIVDGDAATPA
jgi:hypothetical protein